MSMTLYIMDCVVLGLQLIEADSHAILYGIILIIVYTMVLNQVLMSGNARIQVKIVSRRYEEINRLIAERIDCGTSLLHMETGYLHRGAGNDSGGDFQAGSAQAEQPGHG